jgi:hypothetical protein
LRSARAVARSDLAWSAVLRFLRMDSGTGIGLRTALETLLAASLCRVIHGILKWKREGLGSINEGTALYVAIGQSTLMHVNRLKKRLAMHRRMVLVAEKQSLKQQRLERMDANMRRASLCTDATVNAASGTKFAHLGLRTRTRTVLYPNSLALLKHRARCCLQHLRRMPGHYSLVELSFGSTGLYRAIDSSDD